MTSIGRAYCSRRSSVVCGSYLKNSRNTSDREGGAATSDENRTALFEVFLARELSVLPTLVRVSPRHVLTTARMVAEVLCREIYARDVSDPGKLMLDELIKQLVQRKLLPLHIAVLLGTIQAFGNFAVHAMDLREVSVDYVAPAVSALRQLLEWFHQARLDRLLPDALKLALGAPGDVRETNPVGARITVMNGDGSGRSVLIPVGASIRVGRRPESDLKLPETDRKVSRDHLELALSSEGLVVRDLGSKNGAMIDGEVLASRTSRRIAHGSTLRVGSTLLRAEFDGRLSLPDANETSMLDEPQSTEADVG